MLDDNDTSLLRRTISRNSCVLFLGAGFSAEATALNDLPFPSSKDLARQLWNELGYESDYGPFSPAQAPLDKIFDVARRKKGDAFLLNFLRQRLLVKAFPHWYGLAALPYWFRIYTTNVDDLVEKLYKSAKSIGLDAINALTIPPRDRDVSLSKIQYVKLNGTLTESLDSLVFGTRQFAARLSEDNPWYSRFVRDYSQHVTLLVGTEIDEPLFWQALVARQGRAGAPAEHRLRSFLISPAISPVVIDQLADFNVKPVRATAHEFFEYLMTKVIDAVPKYEEVLTYSNPSLAHFARFLEGPHEDANAVKSFFGAFERVSGVDVNPSYRSTYLLGSSPTWDDIGAGLDALRLSARDLEYRIDSYLDAPGEAQAPAIVLAGHRGSGKSTCLRRISTNLAAAGHLVFFATGDELPSAPRITRALDTIGKQCVVVIDDAEWLGSALAGAIRQISQARVRPQLLIAIRANAIHLIDSAKSDVHEEWLSDLKLPEIESLIEVLKREQRLGAATSLKDEELRALFKTKARRQLLVAMMEITTGLEFHDIIRREVADIIDPELVLLYVAVCIVTASGSALGRDQLLGLTTLPPARALSAVGRELRQMLITTAEDRVSARHALIAEDVVSGADRVVLATAYRRLVRLLVQDMDEKATSGRGRRLFVLYKRLINHDVLVKRFAMRPDLARGVYESIANMTTGDSHYWLQFGSLELQLGELDVAGVYIATAESLSPSNWHIQNTRGHLLLAQGRVAPDRPSADRLREEGERVLRALIELKGEESPYPYHTLMSHWLDWVYRWCLDKEERRPHLEALREIAADAIEMHPRHVPLRALRDRVEHEYLDLGAVDSS